MIPPSDAGEAETPVKESARDFNDGATIKAACEDCGLPYEDFPLDTVMPDADWLEIHPSGDGGLLCAGCIANRAAKLPETIVVFARLVRGPEHAAFRVAKNIPWPRSDAGDGHQPKRQVTNGIGSPSKPCGCGETAWCEQHRPQIFGGGNQQPPDLAAENAALRASLKTAQKDIDLFWHMVENGWDIEPRAYFEKEARTNGFDSPLAQAAHHMWKRDPNVAILEAQVKTAEQERVKARAMFWPAANDLESHLYEIRNGQNAEYVLDHAKAVQEEAVSTLLAARERLIEQMKQRFYHKATETWIDTDIQKYVELLSTLGSQA